MAIKAFEIDYGRNDPRAVAEIVDHADVLLEFHRYQAERWIHLRTTNLIECTFATVPLPTKITKGPGSHAAGLAMAWSRCWRLSSLKDQWHEPGLRASSDAIRPPYSQRRRRATWLSDSLRYAPDRHPSEVRNLPDGARHPSRRESAWVAFCRLAVFNGSVN